MDRQWCFDTAVQGILKQGARSHVLNDATSCQYYNARTGNKCAIGHLLSESNLELAHADHEGDGVFSLLEEFDIYQQPEVEDTDDRDFLERLQGMHDNAQAYGDLTEMQIFRQLAHAFADEHQLDPKVLHGQASDVQ